MTTKKRQFPKGIKLRPDTDALVEEGEVKYDDTAKKVQYQDDSATRSVVSEDGVQTLENKTIDATAATGNNTLSADSNDIEYDNASSTLVATDVKAALDEVDARLLAQDEADEIAYDNSTSGLAAVEVQSAIDEVEARVDTIEAETYVNSFNTRIGDVTAQASDYDADQIDYDNATSGLAATDAQAAIDEVEARVDTIEGETYVNSFNTRLGDVLPAASDYDADQVDFDNAASGLAAVEVQAALDEIDSNLDNHIIDTTTHGTTGDIVGTSDSQTLTNKTINSSDIDLGTASDTNKLVVSKDTTANLEALTREAGSVYYSTDDETYKGDDGSDLIDLGGGAGGGLDVFSIENFERNKAADLSSGNSVTPFDSGTLDGTLADNELTPISNTRSIKYTMGASSTNDWFNTEIIEVDPKQQSKNCKATFYAKYNGSADEVKFIVYDVTNSIELATLNINDANLRRYELGFIPSSTTTSIKTGFQVVTGNSAKILEFDDIELAVLGQGEFVVNETGKSEVKVDGGNGVGATDTFVRRFTGVGHQFGDDIEYSDSAANGSTFTINSDGIYYINWKDQTNASLTHCITKNSSILNADPVSLPQDEMLTCESNGTTNRMGATWIGYLEAGDVIRAQPDIPNPFTDTDSDIIAFTIGKVKALGGDRRIVYLSDHKSTTTVGGGSVGSAWTTRDLNTIKGNQSFLDSLSSNQFTLKAGTYRIVASAPAFRSGVHRIRLQNITDATTTLYGAGEQADSPNEVSNRAFLDDEFTITDTKVFEIQHFVSATKTINGFGLATADGSDEIYTMATIEDINTGGSRAEQNPVIHVSHQTAKATAGGSTGAGVNVSPLNVIAGDYLSMGASLYIGPGSNLLINGDFETGDLTGWSDASQGSGSISVNGSNQVVTDVISSGNSGRVEQTVTGLTIGVPYVVEYEVVNGGAGGTNDRVQIVGGVSQDNQGVGVHTLSFTATATSHTFRMSNSAATPGDIIYDNVSFNLLSTNQILLQPGTYRVNDAWGTLKESDQSQILLYDATTASYLIEGQSLLISSTNNESDTINLGSGDFILNTASNIELHLYASAAKTTTGLGDTIPTAPGTNLKRSSITIEKIG